MKKALLVTSRWSGLGSIVPAVGRPYLDLILMALGYAEMGVLEVDPNAPLDLNALEESYDLVMIQGAWNSRLRRSLFSGLGLSLWVDSTGSSQLRVAGGRRLRNVAGDVIGFVLHRRGRTFVFSETSLWDGKDSLLRILPEIPLESGELYSWPGPLYDCWMVENGDNAINWQELLDKSLSQCRVHQLPTGDTALMIPLAMAKESREHVAWSLADRLYAREPVPLEDLLADGLIQAEKTVSTAESCTAGLISARLSAVPGSSAYLLEGIATYSNDAKIRHIDAIEPLIKSLGAVSSEVAVNMAKGVRRTSGSNLAVAVTGIAGPGGGSEEKPVGTVYIAAVSEQGTVLDRHMVYSGDRDSVRLKTSQTALHLLRRLLLKG